MKIIYRFLLIILCILIIQGCKNKNDYNYNYDKVVDKVKIFINNKEYSINLEKNITVDYLINLLPLEFEMNELNGNEKYIYLNDKLPVNEERPNYINSGDVMMYGNNCLVIFYKSFNTSYSYTKIGHIDNLPDLNNDNIKVKIEKY